MQAIVLARLRGVDVRIVVPLKPDSRLVELAEQSFVQDAVAANVSVYYYTQSFIHHKIILSDDVTSIGSANLDRRSMLLNFELTGLIHDEEMARQVSRIFERDFTGCVNATPEDWTNLTSVKRFVIRLARLASPVL